MATARPRHSRRHSSSLASEQERLARKREQNRIAQQVYRRAQKERIQALEAAVAKSLSSGGGPWTQFDDVPGNGLFFGDGPAGTPSLSSATSAAADARSFPAGLFQASLDPSLDHSLNPSLGDGHIGGPGDFFGEYTRQDGHTTTATTSTTATTATTDIATTSSFSFGRHRQETYGAESAPDLTYESMQADDISILGTSPPYDGAATATVSTWSHPVDGQTTGAVSQEQPVTPPPDGTARREHASGPGPGRRHGRRTALHIAASQSNSCMVKLLLGRGADAGPLDEDGRTPLHLAVIAAADAARRSSSSSSRSSSNGRSSADGSGNSDGGGGDRGDHGGEDKEAETTLRLLLRARAAGADPRALDRCGRSVLFAAVATGCEAAVQIVLDAMGSEGPAASSPNPGSGASKGVASDVGHADIRATLNEPDAQGTLPLHLAVASGSASMVLLLLSNGADING